MLLYRILNDDFLFEYSTDGSDWPDILTVNDTTERVYTASLPSSLSGTVYVRVVDTDRTRGNRALDTIYIDEMYILSNSGAAASQQAAAAVDQLLSADSDDDDPITDALATDLALMLMG